MLTPLFDGEVTGWRCIALKGRGCRSPEYLSCAAAPQASKPIWLTSEHRGLVDTAAVAVAAALAAVPTVRCEGSRSSGAAGGNLQGNIRHSDCRALVVIKVGLQEHAIA